MTPADFDLLAKLVTMTGGIIGIGKLAYDFFVGNRIRMRDDYKFAKEFLKDLAENGGRMHHLQKEKGYQALAGSREVSGEEIEYVLTLLHSDVALDNLVLARKYLAYTRSDRKIVFSLERYRLRWYRLILKGTYGSFYVLCGIASILPWLFSTYLTISVQIMGFTVFGTYALFAVRALARIVRAENLVHGQQTATPANDEPSPQS